MSRIPAWLYVFFGVIAAIAGALGVAHAPNGLPKIFWAVVIMLGAASLALSWVVGRAALKQRS